MCLEGDQEDKPKFFIFFLFYFLKEQRETIIMVKKPINLQGNIKLKELESILKKFRKRGLKPFIKGKGSGQIKIQFE